MAYDIIGDIHGQADKLHALLSELGYVNRDGAYRHPERTALFVGDFIDRGPQQLSSVMTVRRMVDAGSAQAVMGNHEFNAIAWHTPDPTKAGEHLRPRGAAENAVGVAVGLARADVEGLAAIFRADRKAGLAMADVFPFLRHLNLPTLVKIDEILLRLNFCYQQFVLHSLMVFFLILELR